MRTVLTLFLLSALATPLLAAGPSPDLEARRKALNDLLHEHWEYTLSHSPIFASIIGDKRWNDKVDDFSQAAIDSDNAKQKEFLARFEAIDTTGFPEQEALNKALMVRNLREQVEGQRFKFQEMPVSQLDGIHLDAPQLAAFLEFKTVKDYDDYISRLKQIPRAFDENVVQMRKGMADHLMPPKFLLEKVSVQAEGIGNAPPDQSPFVTLPLAKMPKEIPQAEQERIRTQMIAVVRDQVNPAYLSFARFVKEEYAPQGRSEPGIWSLPDGDARYAFLVRQTTTTRLTPDEIHQTGLKEVARIEGEELAIARKLGYKDLKSFAEHVKTDPALHGHSREQILDLYRKYEDGMRPMLPKLFGRLPQAPFAVEAVESFREKEAPGAQYQQSTPDGSRPGRVQVNTSDPEKRSLLDIEATAYHEGLPGHHLQIAIQQELPALPPFRQQGGNGAFVEGWALYAEHLGKDVGFYQDPYSDYGRLESEMLRAIRLVVDTGIHSKHWSREQVIQYFHDHSALDEPTVQSETDRYMSWPSQALGYKVGQLEFLKLRARAQQALGDKFDLRGFHDQCLDAGSLPMDVLETRIDAWIATQKGAAGSPAAH
jgi:uncharacterized protein (DUF885 family)